jgi:hypothetical protein
MNDELQNTLNLFAPGVQGIDPNLAITHLKSWQAALPKDGPTTELHALLGRAAELLQDGQLDRAAILLPVMATQVEMVSSMAPASDRDGLKQLVEVLREADQGPTQ